MLVSEPAVHTFTIESEDGQYRLFLGEDLVDVYPNLHRAQFGAFLAARDIDLGVKRLQFEEDEAGNLVAVLVV
ncbi:MAG TPA: hypothetical protein VGF59_30465 [Bryobacteraceae bacterium]|jgi:hypothetical protein